MYTVIHDFDTVYSMHLDCSIYSLHQRMYIWYIKIYSFITPTCFVIM